MMKHFLQQIISKELAAIGFELAPEKVTIDIPKSADHGDYATNAAMVLAKAAGVAPRQLAEKINLALSKHDQLFGKIEIAGPGFINFFLQASAYHQALGELYDGVKVNLPTLGKHKRVLVEFVSANPTGPLHIGHGRNAVVGDVLARLFTAVGYEVEREFYINDGGVQIHTLGVSAQYYLKLQSGESVSDELSENVYRGEYLNDLVKLRFAELTPIAHDITAIGKLLAKDLLAAINVTLKNIRVNFQNYFSEAMLYENGAVTKVLADLSAHLYEAENALWFKSTEFGDDKDRVLRKNDGTYTYLTPDMAYHRDKFNRGFDLYVNVWGADHGGYIARIKAGVAALGFDANKLQVLLMQLVNLVSGDEQLKMSKRKGTVVTLNEVLEAVGADVVRFFLVMRSHHTTLDFDLALAKQQSSENPVYYVQYAHARVAAILRKAIEAGYQPKDWQHADLSPIVMPEELELIKKMLSLGEMLVEAAQIQEPHRVAFYVLDLAKCFQAYYTQGKMHEEYRVIQANRELTLARLRLVASVQAVLKVCFEILGVNAPETM